MTFLEKIYFPKTSWTYVLCGYKMVNEGAFMFRFMIKR